MRWKLCYIMMTVTLVSVLGYSVYSGINPNSVFSHELDEAFGFDSSNQIDSISHHNGRAPDAEKSAQLRLGSSRDEVMDALGPPTMFDEDNDRWVYGSHTLMFKHNRVIGCIKSDPVRTSVLSLEKVKNVFNAPVQTESKSTSDSSKKEWGKIMTLDNTRSAQVAPPSGTTGSYAGRSSRYSTGSSRQRGGYAGYGNYYMSRFQRNYSRFYRQPILPRGMPRYHQRSRSGYGNFGYGFGNQGYSRGYNRSSRSPYGR